MAAHAQNTQNLHTHALNPSRTLRAPPPKAALLLATKDPLPVTNTRDTLYATYAAPPLPLIALLPATTAPLEISTMLAVVIEAMAPPACCTFCQSVRQGCPDLSDCRGPSMCAISCVHPYPAPCWRCTGTYTC